jgi:hypothetical protein
MEHEVTFVFIRVNTVANSAVLHLRHDFYNIILETEHKLYIASGSGPPLPPPPAKNSGRVPAGAHSSCSDVQSVI